MHAPAQELIQINGMNRIQKGSTAEAAVGKALQVNVQPAEEGVKSRGQTEKLLKTSHWQHVTEERRTTNR